MTRDEAQKMLRENLEILWNSVGWFEVEGQPTLFSFYDVCHALMLCPHCESNTLHEAGILQIRISTQSGGHTIIPVISEQIVYCLIFNSDTPVTAQFQEWHKIISVPPDDDEQFIKSLMEN